MTSLANFPTDILYYTGPELGGSIFHFIVSLVGVTLLSLVLYVSLKERNTPESMLILSFIVADLLQCLLEMIYGAIDLRYGGFATGRIGCLIKAVLHFATATASLLAMAVITIERYLFVIHRIIITENHARMINAFVWVFASGFALMPVYTLNYLNTFALQPAKLHCSIASWETVNVFTRVFVILTIVVIVGLCALHVAGYTSIVSAYSNAIHKGKKRRKISTKERQLLIKVIGLTTIPFSVEFIIEAATGVPTSSAYNAFGCIMAVLNSAMNGVLLITFDSKINANVRELLGANALSVKSDTNPTQSKMSKQSKLSKNDSSPSNV